VGLFPRLWEPTPQATNLGIVAMSSSVEDISVDMLRYVLDGYVREETLTAANAAHC